MAFPKALAAFAALATVLHGLFFATLAAGWITLETNPLRWTTLGITVVVVLVLPVVASVMLIRALEARDRKIKRSTVLFALVGLLNATVLGLSIWAVGNPVGTVLSGSTLLIHGVPTQSIADVVPDKPEPTSNSVAEAQKAVAAALFSDDPAEISEALSDESAAALAAAWMGFMHAEFGADLQRRVDAETWNVLQQGLPDGVQLSDDPAALEPHLVKDGRAHLARVGAVAKSLVDGDGGVALTAPYLPNAVVRSGLLEGRDLAWDARYTEVAMNRVEARIADRTFDIRFEDGAWRVHLGDYGELATRRVAPALMFLALRD